MTVLDVFGKERKEIYAAINDLQEFAAWAGPAPDYQRIRGKQCQQGFIRSVEPLTVSGHQLAPGQYKLTWDGTGSSVELMILSPARLIELGQAGRENATESHKNDDGSQSLTQIDFAGKKYALAFAMESAATDPASQDGSQ